MKQYVLTRASYGPEWELDANRRRLAMTRAVTARLLSKQTVTDWTWVVLMDTRDALFKERFAVFHDHAPHVEVIAWTPTNVTNAPWDKKPIASHQAQVAATAYKHPGWLAATPRDDIVVASRLDDDDGLALDALERFQNASDVDRRTALMLPMGFRVWNGRMSRVRHETNAMHALVTPPGDTTTVYDYGHRLVGRGQPVVAVDEEPGWLWVRHADTLSGWKKADVLITNQLRRLFPVDWATL